MSQIIVDDEQARLIAQSKEPVQIRDRSGRVLGYVSHGFTEEDIAIAKERAASDEPRYTTQEVLNYLRSLDSQ